MTSDPHSDHDVLEKTKQKTQQPTRYRVTLLNDDYTTMEFVVQILENIFHKTPAEAYRIMMQVHTAGRQDGLPGYALRFPRLISFRDDDKRSEDATTVREIREMFASQYGGQQLAKANSRL